MLDGDDESDRAILNSDGIESPEHKGPGIMKSTDVQVTVSEDTLRDDDDERGEGSGRGSNHGSGGRQSPRAYKEPSIDWASPHIESGSAGGGGGGGMHHAR